MSPQTPPLGRTVKGLPRYFMDCGWWRHPRFVGLDLEALFTFQAIVSYSTEHATDGVIPSDLEDLGIALGIRQASLGHAIPALLERGVIAAKGAPRTGHPQAYEVRNWAEHNPTAEEVQAYNQAKSRKGTLGAHKRWHESRGVIDPECEWCTNAPGMPQAMPQEYQAECHGMGWDGNPPSPPVAQASPETPRTAPGRGLPGGGRDLSATQIIDMAIDIMATCDLERARAEGGAIRNPQRWKAKAADTRRQAHAETMSALVAEQPDIDPATLAEQVDPTTGPLDGGTARAEASSALANAEASIAAQARAAIKRRRAEADAAIAALDADQREALRGRAIAAIELVDGYVHETTVVNRMRELIRSDQAQEAT